MDIPIYKPYINMQSILYASDALSSGWLSSLGKYKQLAEEKLKELFGYKYVLLTCNGTAANHLISKCLQYKYPFKKTIICPNNVYVAAWNAFLYDNYYELIAMDSNLDTWNIDLSFLEKQENLKYIFLVVHNLGNPIDVDYIKYKCPNSIIVEDNCEGFLGKYRASWTGTESLCSSISFFANKSISSVIGTTPIFIKYKNKIWLENIKKIVRKTSKLYNLECACFDNKGKIIWKKIDNFIEHKYKGIIKNIKLDKGRNIEITEDHSVFTFNGKSIIKVLGKDLKVGDYLLCPRNIFNKEENHTIDLADLDIDNLKIYKNYVQIKKFGVGGGGGKRINRFIILDKDFAKFLGYYVAEGCYNLNYWGVSFHFSKKEFNTYVKEVEKLYKKIFPGWKVNKYEYRSISVIKLGGIIFKRLLDYLEVGRDSYSVQVPPFIFNSSLEVKEAFISGLINGDGHNRILNGCFETSLSTASKKLANSFHYLLLSMGINSSIYVDKKTNNYKVWIGGNGNNGIEYRIPKEVINLTLKAQNKHIKRLKEKKSIFLNTAKIWLDEKRIDENINILLNDVCLLKIKNIEEYNYNGFVYDLQIDKYENFIGGNGAVCFHNSGEGGAFITTDEELYEYANSIHGQGQSKERYIHDKLGYNYRMTNIQAAILLGQLEILDEIIDRKYFVFDYYNDQLKNIPEIKFQKVDHHCTHSNWMFAVRIIGNKSYDNINNFFSSYGIETRPIFYPITYHKHLKDNDLVFCSSIKNSEILSKECFMLPSYPQLERVQLEYIVDKVKAYVFNVREDIKND